MPAARAALVYHLFKEWLMPEPSRNNRFAELRRGIVGIDRKVPLMDGREVPYVYLDNAASTPVLGQVMDAVERPPRYGFQVPAKHGRLR